jgi:hypothetical protein
VVAERLVKKNRAGASTISARGIERTDLNTKRQAAAANDRRQTAAAPIKDGA